MNADLIRAGHTPANPLLLMLADRLLNELKEDGKIRTEFAFPVQAAQLGNDLTIVALPGACCQTKSFRSMQRIHGATSLSASALFPGFGPAARPSHPLVLDQTAAADRC